jgi:hypothetical protein
MIETFSDFKQNAAHRKKQGEPMKSRLLMPALALALAFATVATASESLVLNGSGLRTKMILGAMYDLALNVPESLKGSDGKTLIESDQPMEFVLTLKSSLITRARFVEATSEGFAKAAEAGYASDQTPAFLDQFANTEFKKGDVITMSYGPGGLTTLYRKLADGSATRLGTIPGLDLKKALFAIWLGDKPVQASLKKALLGTP